VPSTIGASCSATPPRSPHCSIACSTTPTSSNAGLGAGAPRCNRTCARRTPRSRTPLSRSLVTQWPVLHCPPMAGFQLSTEVLARKDEPGHRCCFVDQITAATFLQCCRVLHRQHLLGAETSVYVADGVSAKLVPHPRDNPVQIA